MTKQKEQPAAAPKYRARVGFNYPNPAGPQTVVVDGKERVEREVRVEVGDVVELPAAVAKGQLEQNAVELVKEEE